MDFFRDYLDLEALLVVSLQEAWAKEAASLYVPISAALKAEDWATAFKLAEAVDMTVVGESCKDLAYSVFQECVTFGARVASDDHPLVSGLDFDTIVKRSVSLFLQSIEWNCTKEVQTSILQSIADAQKKTITKADAVRPFVSFKDSGDKMLQLISGLHTHRLGSWGFIAEAEVRGFTTYKLSAHLDLRTSEFCKFINGKEFRVEDARTIIETAVHTDAPDDLKAIQPWPKQDKESIAKYATMSQSELIANKLHVPPFHPYCRTLLVRVDHTVNISKPAPVEQVLPSYTVTPDSFKVINSSLRPEDVKVWDEFVNLNPVDVLSAVTRQPPSVVISEDIQKKISITPSEDVRVKFSFEKDGLAVKATTLLETHSGILSVPQLVISKGSQKQVENYFLGLQSGLVNIAKSVGAKTVSMAVGEGQALTMATLGYKPTAYAWQIMRRSMKTALVAAYALETEELANEKKDAIREILDSKDEYGLIALTDIGLPESLLAALYGSLTYNGFLDITSKDQVSRLQSAL